MTVGEAAELVLGSSPYDTALPQEWLNNMSDLLRRCYSYDDIGCSFVWAYDNKAGISGRPCALTDLGNCILKDMNRLMGWSHPLTDVTVDKMAQPQP